MDVIRSHGVDSANVDIVNREENAFDFLNGAGQVLDTVPLFSTEALDNVKFMNDDLVVYFSEPQSDTESQLVEVNVNGDYRCIIRGTEATIKRYHVAVLAQAKQARVRQTRVVNPDGSIGYQEKMVHSLTYPFQVISDPQPRKGIPWLKTILANNQ